MADGSHRPPPGGPGGAAPGLGPIEADYQAWEATMADQLADGAIWFTSADVAYTAGWKAGACYMVSRTTDVFTDVAATVLASEIPDRIPGPEETGTGWPA